MGLQAARFVLRIEIRCRAALRLRQLARDRSVASHVYMIGDNLDGLIDDFSASRPDR